MKIITPAAVVIAALAFVGASTGPAAAHNNGYGEAPNHYASSNFMSGSVVGGGKMYYGVHQMLNGDDRNNDSSYYHATKKHRASVKNSTGNVIRSGDKGGGTWAQATQDATAWGNEAYWFVY